MPLVLCCVAPFLAMQFRFILYSLLQQSISHKKFNWKDISNPTEICIPIRLILLICMVYSLYTK